MKTIKGERIKESERGILKNKYQVLLTRSEWEKLQGMNDELQSLKEKLTVENTKRILDNLDTNVIKSNNYFRARAIIDSMGIGNGLYELEEDIQSSKPDIEKIDLRSLLELLETSKRYLRVTQDVNRYSPDDYEDAKYELILAITKAEEA